MQLRKPADPRTRALCLALACCFLLLYLQWGSRGEFVYQMVTPILKSGGADAWLHPLVLGPFLGLLLLVLAAVVPRLPRWLILVAMLPPAALGLLVLIGGLGAGAAGWRMIVSAIPFLTALMLLLRRLVRR